MSKTIIRAVVVLAALMLVACGNKGDDKEGKGGGDKAGKSDKADKGKSGGAVAGSCDMRGVKGMGFQTCTEYTGSNWTAKEIEQQCSSGTFIAGSCPADGIVVSCQMYAGKASEMMQRYYDKADKAKAACERLEGALQ
jgi:predicted small lipoprotein YifL